jgi:hypothetical protein
LYKACAHCFAKYIILKKKKKISERCLAFCIVKFLRTINTTKYFSKFQKKKCLLDVRTKKGAREEITERKKKKLKMFLALLL